MRWTDRQKNLYCQYKDHTMRFDQGTDWGQAVAAVEEWIRQGPQPSA
jgi:hypothetical protein